MGMLASRNHNLNKLPEGRKLERDYPIPDRMTASQLNPVWQSLAMRSGARKPKLTVGQADDPYEHEADRVADQVMRMPDPKSSGRGLSIAPATSRQAQPKCAECEEEGEEGMLQRKESGSAEAPATAPSIVHETLSSAGEPLDAATRAYFEPRFGHDLSAVRIHTDAHAAESARAIKALGYTAGNQIAFAAGQHSPETSEGRSLI